MTTLKINIHLTWKVYACTCNIYVFYLCVITLTWWIFLLHHRFTKALLFSCRRKRKHGKIWNNARFACILISVAVRFISCLNITIMIAANIIRVKVTSHLIILNSDVISLFCALIDIFSGWSLSDWRLWLDLCWFLMWTWL